MSMTSNGTVLPDQAGGRTLVPYEGPFARTNPDTGRTGLTAAARFGPVCGTPF